MASQASKGSGTAGTATILLQAHMLDFAACSETDVSVQSGVWAAGDVMPLIGGMQCWINY
jgi:hypothetical protein